MALSGVLYVAGPYGEDSIRSITQHFETLLGQPVTLAVKQDGRLIGGFRALIDGRLYDASVLTKAERALSYLKNKG